MFKRPKKKKNPTEQTTVVSFLVIIGVLLFQTLVTLSSVFNCHAEQTHCIHKSTKVSHCTLTQVLTSSCLFLSHSLRRTHTRTHLKTSPHYITVTAHRQGHKDRWLKAAKQRANDLPYLCYTSQCFRSAHSEPKSTSTI